METSTETTKPTLPRTLAEVDAAERKPEKGAFGMDEAELAAGVEESGNKQVPPEVAAEVVALPPSELEAPPPVARVVIEEAPAKNEEVLFEDGDNKVTSRDGLIELLSKNQAPVEAYKPPPMTDRQKAQLQLEQEAGAARVRAHAEQMKHRPPVVISEAEKKAQGSNVPVFRPGDFNEYQPMTAPATSKG